MRFIKEKDVGFAFNLESYLARHSATGLLVAQCSVCGDFGPIAISVLSMNEKYDSEITRDDYWDKLAGYVPIIGHRYGPTHQTFAHQHCFIQVDSEDLADVWIRAKKEKNFALQNYAKSALAMKTQEALMFLTAIPNAHKMIPSKELIKLDLLTHLMEEEFRLIIQTQGCLQCQQNPCACNWVEEQEAQMEIMEDLIFGEMQRRKLVSIF